MKQSSKKISTGTAALYCRLSRDDNMDSESLEAGVFWSILSASLRLSELRKPLILLGFPEFSLSAQGFWDFSHQSRFSGKV